jgi:hypothetical protein
LLPASFFAVRNDGRAGFIPDSDEIIVILLCLNYLSGLIIEEMNKS